MRTAARVKQPSLTNGTTNFVLDAAPTGFRRFKDVFDVIGGSAPGYPTYLATNAAGDEWELGVAQIISTGEGVIDRDNGVIFESSAGGAKVNFTGVVTVRNVTPPDVRQYDRGAHLTLTGPLSISPGESILSWTGLTAGYSDTDNVWSAGAPSVLYIPRWADVVFVQVELHVTGATIAPDFSLWGTSFRDHTAIDDLVLPAQDLGSGAWRIRCGLLLPVRQDVSSPFFRVYANNYNGTAAQLEASPAPMISLRVHG